MNAMRDRPNDGDEPFNARDDMADYDQEEELEGGDEEEFPEDLDEEEDEYEDFDYGD